MLDPSDGSIDWPMFQRLKFLRFRGIMTVVGLTRPLDYLNDPRSFGIDREMLDPLVESLDWPLFRRGGERLRAMNYFGRSARIKRTNGWSRVFV